MNDINQQQEPSEEVNQDAEQEQKAIANENKEEALQEEVVISIGDEELTEKENEAPEWVKDVRRQNRELKKQLKELSAQVDQKNARKKPELGKKPTLADYDYDEDRYAPALRNYYKTQEEIERIDKEEADQKKKEQQDWQSKLDFYNEKKAELSKEAHDMEEAQEIVTEALDVTQQGIIVQGADNPANIVLALKRNDSLRNKLSEIKDPIKFAFAIAKLEKDLRLTKRKSDKPKPEKKVEGTFVPNKGQDAYLLKLRAQAQKTGDFTKVMEYRRSQRARA